MKISIITAVRNGASSIRDCIESVLKQSYKDIEYLIIDGGSTDGTLEVVKRYETRITQIISEPDNGIYDALNKGLCLATGEIVGFLHADDLYAHEHVLENVVQVMAESGVDSCYGDMVYVGRNNPEKVVRYWRSCPFQEGLFQRGWMPPHPTFFVRRLVYDRYGTFNTSFKNSADYELMLRFLVKHKISTSYIPEVMVKMRTGGHSNVSFRNRLRAHLEDHRAWRINGLKVNHLGLFMKPFSKFPQWIIHRG